MQWERILPIKGIPFRPVRIGREGNKCQCCEFSRTDRDVQTLLGISAAC